MPILSGSLFKCKFRNGTILIHIQVYIKNTQVTKTVGYFCEGKQLGNKSHVYIKTVRQQ